MPAFAGGASRSGLIPGAVGRGPHVGVGLASSRAFQRRATSAVGPAWVAELSNALAIPSLRAYGIAKSDFEPMAQKAGAASSMRGNLVALEHDELLAILERAW
jgi:alcohol dehydrogenase class IV